MVATYGMLSTMPDRTADTTRISITASSGVAVGRVADLLGEVADHAGLDQGADHDEQAGEEQQGLPLDAGHVVLGRDIGDQHQQPGAEQRHDRRLDVEYRVPDEAGEHRAAGRRRT